MLRTIRPIAPHSTPIRGFTLIELLIVISIILVLVAIALPHFMNSITRAKVVKARGDLRALNVGLDSYFIDWKVYPCESEAEYLSVEHFEAGLTWLTSPIAYLTTLPEDPFEGNSLESISYELGGVEIPFEERPGGLLAMWVLHSYGPDSPIEENSTSRPNYKITGDGRVASYSATNGTRSAGDISIYGGDARYMGVVIDFADPNLLETADKPGIDIDGQLYLGQFPPPVQ
ncbi:MAG: prepilin-type N-terminal cleavage/methylation domain-containing protein [Candidatus Omnitrophica bacterium]|nr:prepilin-type N-terminal cleavage/methylation domain-containing protein [Candidatus Omnitrophota bacterium]MCA9429834.1 prepilin-type N-terminal cleavage/methylation domain-containing protein [Candidatus Omnitrophota bacterium]MCA9436426.1 prepilin-type N-terminal cleavage/methylation domain-containing protein [Candidatus Omnitrophota bacterium]MCA9445829.1 prepilin-type N-terminal cleavage/methylation domain-containing protein [Candidatus Omnitrophota bacterium]